MPSDLTSKSHVWLRLDQTQDTTDRDLYLCVIYIRPVDSPYFEEEIFYTLHSEIGDFQAQGNVLLTGDLNGQTGIEPDVMDPQATTMYLVRPSCLPHQPSPVGTTLT